VVRALLLCAGMGAWSVALSQGVPLSVATMMSFSIPIIVLPLAFVFLNDRLTKKRLALTAFGFMGIVCILQPSVSCASSVVGVLFMAALFFATLDVLNKKIAVQETMLSMLFYTSFGLLIFTAMPLWWVWKTPHMTDMMLAFLLGAGGNLIFFCILKAFSCVDLSVLSPVRYIELPFTLCIGYVWFNEVPTTLSLVGTVFIVISALAIARQP
jgi:S-adenosylmethionine uptake transporter